MSRINFSQSEIVNDVYFSNEEIAENLEKIELIMHYHDSKSFLKFFKNKFIFNLSNYSQHPNVIEQVNNEDNNTDNILSIQPSHLPVQNIMETINSHTSLKQKFKAAL